MTDEKKTYPAAPDEQGYYFENQDDETAGILTKDYDNGSAIKKVALSNGKEAIIRKLKGRDFVETKRRIEADRTLDFETVNMSIATRIDGKTEPPEYYLDDLYQEDYSTLMVAYGRLNFQ